MITLTAEEFIAIGVAFTAVGVNLGTIIAVITRMKRT